MLLTRFNIQYESDDVRGLQPAWLEERIRLFKEYCLPSVLHQTCRDFIWILVGDIRTPNPYKQRVEHFASVMPQIRVIWWPFDADDEDYHIPYKNLGGIYAEGKDALITSRLDSDDALPANYIERVQKVAQSGVEGIVSFPVGKQTFVRDNKSYRVHYVPNHFTSRIERSGFETIMAYNHALLEDAQFHIVETEEPMWEEIVHGGNVSNDYVPKYRYHITGLSDICDLSKRWVLFQTSRLMRLRKRLFVAPDKAH
ncbi:MAG: hypothetical protein J6T80_03715 [Paludibacteraceae bacterium]|nr:hypothetical protein [Paludibacteraceae bacterium]